MKKISLHTFKHTLRDIHKQTENRKFCFIIGAGASFKSGIPTGGQLAQKWFNEINDIYETTEIDDWIKEVNIDKTDLAAHYGSIYRKRFESDKTSGYEFLVQAMRDAKPTFGHFVLAQILSKAPGNCVLTTNFDSLIESAIYQFTDKTPLVCGHESLSGYARPSSIHPLIIKIHRDLLLSPKSDLDEISKLDKGWEEPLEKIFNSHIPIIIGYGGNDGSLMDYFEKMKKPSNFFWCFHKSSLPPRRVQSMVEKMDGSFIEIDGFDEMMKELLWVFDEIKPVKEELDAVSKNRIESMSRELAEIDVKSEKSNPALKKKEFSAFEYAAKAKNESDLEKRKKIYIEAIEKFPSTAWLWDEFVYFLHYIKKDYSNLEKYYLMTLAFNPEKANINGNFANFLKSIKKDYDKAEKHYLKALSIEPKNANFNGNYAIYLEDNKQDYNNAEKYYLKAINIDPENANHNGNYAKMLLSISNKKEVAVKYLDKAFALNKDKKNDLLVELWFYRYAHYLEWYVESEKVLDSLLKQGINSPGWNLEKNVEAAIAMGHPNPKKLKEFANAITKLN